MVQSQIDFFFLNTGIHNSLENKQKQLKMVPYLHSVVLNAINTT